MAQSRIFKVGTVYSRMKRLLEKEATSPENKPVWYEIYEAFPPKYEPRIDRHTLPHGVGSRVKSMPPPPKILYKEDKIRAQYYKAFMPTDTDKEVLPLLDWKCPNCGISNKGFRESCAKCETVKPLFNVENKANTEVFNLSDNSTKTFSQVFVEKYNEIEETKQVEDIRLFTTTVQALKDMKELGLKDGVDLQEEVIRPKYKDEVKVKGRRKHVPSFDESVDSRALREESSKRLPGDWDCPACNAHNFMRNIECFKCRCPRPLDTDVKTEAPKYPTFVREPIADISYDDLIPKEDTQGLDPVDSIDVKRPKLRPNVADLFNSEDDNDNSKK